MSSIDGVYSRVVGLEVNEVADGMVVFDPSREQVHYLNSTAAVVFEFCNGTHTARDIADNAAALFPESDEDWKQVVIECLADLGRLHLVETVDSSAGASHR